MQSKPGPQHTPRILCSRPSLTHLGLWDCDCACSLDLPPVLVSQPASRPFDCDCACALDLPPESASPIEGVVWRKPPELFSVPLVEGWQAYFNPQGPIGVTVANRTARQVLETFDASATTEPVGQPCADLPPAVLQETLARLSLVGLLQPAAKTPAAVARSSTLTLWLHVTEACNLRCEYCYVNKRPQAMAAETGCRIVDRALELARRHGYTTLKLKYAGGEPTLNFSVVRATHAHAADRATQAGIRLEEVLLTNGVGVIPQTLDFVAQAGMRLMVSLDGGAQVHDHLRVRRDGQGTHAHVVNTLHRALGRGLRPSISITLTARNLDGLSDAVTFALEHNLPFNLNFLRECSALSSALVPEPERLKEAVRDVFDLVRQYPDYALPLTGILDRIRLDVPHSHACAAGRDYLAFDAAGQAAACQMLLDAPWSNLADDDILGSLRRRGRRTFQPAQALSNCRGCLWRSACAGGCPLLRGNALHDRYCQAYQTLLPELVALEGHRLLTADRLASSCLN